MSDRIHMGTINVWRWYFCWPIDSYVTANWYARPKVSIDGRWTINRQAPTRFAGKRYRFLTITFHKRAWRIGVWPIRWELETVFDFIEENGGTPHVPPTPPAYEGGTDE